VSKRTSADVRKFMKENQIDATGTDLPKPVTTWEESSLPPFLLEPFLSNPKFVKPSPI
jgi:hypothetical protein